MKLLARLKVGDLMKNSKNKEAKEVKEVKHQKITKKDTKAKKGGCQMTASGARIVGTCPKNL